MSAMSIPVGLPFIISLSRFEPSRAIFCRISQILLLVLWGGLTQFRAWSQDTGGTVDLGFDPKAGPDRPVVALAIQSDGKIVIGGGFTAVDERQAVSFLIELHLVARGKIVPRHWREDGRAM